MNFPDQRANQGADGDSGADEGDISYVGRAIRDTKHFGGRRSVLCTADNGENVAAIDLGIRHDGNGSGGGATSDLPEKNAAGAGKLREFSQGLAVHGFVGDIRIDALDRNAEQFGIVDLSGAFPCDFNEDFACAGDADDIAFMQQGVRGGILDGTIAANTLNKNTGVRDQRFRFDGAKTNYFAARLHAEAAGLPTVPSGASSAEFFLATKLFLVLLAGAHEVHANE